MVKIMAILAACLSLWESDAATLQQVVNARGCSTVAVAGLSKQLVEQVNCLRPNLFGSLNNIPYVALGDAVRAVPYAQKPLIDALKKSVNAAKRTIVITSALRSIAQQLLLYRWSNRDGIGGCGITIAAPPGRSNHNGGLAIDIQDPYSWRSRLQPYGFRHFGPSDPPHFDYIAGGTEIRVLSTKAFQILWNLNNPSDKIPEDGAYGPATEARLLKSPAGGFPKGASCGGSVGPAVDPNACTVNGKPGTCKSVSSCAGVTYAGYCPGASNIQCCIPSTAKSASTPAPLATTTKAAVPTTAAPQTFDGPQCQASFGAAAACQDSSTCGKTAKRGGFTTGLCSGAASITCCLNFNFVNAFKFYSDTDAQQTKALETFQTSKLQFMPTQFQTFACLYRGRISSAGAWNSNLGWCGTPILLTQVAQFYEETAAQVAALNYLQDEVEKTADRSQLETLVKTFRKVGSGSTSPPNNDDGKCAKKPASQLQLNQAGLELITHFEGFYGYCYKDSVGIWTIGYGHACHVNSNDGSGCGPNGSCSGTMSREKAKQFLAKDMEKFSKCVQNAVKVPITDNQFAALVSFAFNVGCGALQSSTLLTKLNSRTLTRAEVQYQFSRWHTKCTEGLKRRRFTEALLFNSCDASIDCTYSSCSVSYGYQKCRSNCDYCSACRGCSGDSTSVSSNRIASVPDLDYTPNCANATYSAYSCESPITERIVPVTSGAGNGCDVFCNNVTSHCGGAVNNTLYESFEECMTDCSYLPQGPAGDKTANSQVCRRLVMDDIVKSGTSTPNDCSKIPSTCTRDLPIEDIVDDSADQTTAADSTSAAGGLAPATYTSLLGTLLVAAGFLRWM